MQKLPPAHAPAWQFCCNCAIAVIPFQWTPGLVKLLSMEGCFLSCENNFFMKRSGLEGLVTYFQLVEIISWKCKHKKKLRWTPYPRYPGGMVAAEKFEITKWMGEARVTDFEVIMWKTKSLFCQTSPGLFGWCVVAPIKFFIEVCHFFSPFDHIQTSEVCNSPYKP